jgi:hypothetical protein
MGMGMGMGGAGSGGKEGVARTMDHGPRATELRVYAGLASYKRFSRKNEKKIIFF